MANGDGNRYGLQTGLTRGQFLAALFGDQHEARLDDESLSETMRAEFPNSGVEYGGVTIRMYRNKYNRGEFGCQAGPPAIQVPMYRNGDPVSPGKLPGPAPRQYWQEKNKRQEEVE